MRGYMYEGGDIIIRNINKVLPIILLYLLVNGLRLDRGHTRRHNYHSLNFFLSGRPLTFTTYSVLQQTKGMRQSPPIGVH